MSYSPPTLRSRDRSQPDKKKGRRSLSVDSKPLSSYSNSVTSDSIMPPKTDSSLIDSCVNKILTSTDILDNLASKLMVQLKAVVEEAVTEALGKALEKIDSLSTEVGDLRLRVDDLEQYQRRSNVRIFGLPEKRNEDTDQLVLSLFNDQLKVDVSAEQIDRSHRVGVQQRPGPDGKARPRPIIVRFVSYRDRRRVFDAKKLLKNTGIVILEDLTKTRLQVYQAAAEKHGRRNTWTVDGRVKWVTGSGPDRRIHTATRLADTK